MSNFEKACLRKALIAAAWIQKKRPIKLWCNNLRAIKLIKNAEKDFYTKHINVQYHHIKKIIGNRVIQIYYVPNIEMAANIIIKPLTKSAF